MFIGNFNQIRSEVSQRLRGLHVSKIDQIIKKKVLLKIILEYVSYNFQQT